MVKELEKSKIVGHQVQMDFLRRQVDQKRLASTMLFSGPEGVGKLRVAKYAAQLLVCQNQTACGVCGKCQRIWQEQSEDLYIVKAVEHSIKIEQARDIIHFLSLRAVGNAKIIIIDGIEDMTIQAANSLLKSLEEPPVDTYFFLITSQLGRVLTTIRSRAQLVRFSPLGSEQIQQVTGATGWVLNSSAGSCRRAQQMQSELGEETRQKAFQFAQKLLRRELEFAEVASFAVSSEEALELSYFWQQVFRDLVFQNRGLDHLIHEDFQTIYSRFSDVEESKLLRLSGCSIRFKRKGWS